MSNIGIVAIGYNRPESMHRLLSSLKAAEYDGDNVPLFISLDNCGDDRVQRIADAFDWPFGKKTVILHSERLGLRKHILQCGSLLEALDGLVVLEDDIVVAPGFFLYAKASVQKYGHNDRIAGISLYNHLWNVNTYAPFQPSLSAYDTYFFQFAQSWGQVWMKEQWREFTDWYEKNSEGFTKADHLPASICKWPETSWLKYHIKYCVEKNKYFVYPYKSLSTCFAESGEHNKRKTYLVQVPLMQGIKRDFDFPELDNPSAVLYDVFFERVLRESDIPDIDADSICVDLYCSKASYADKKYVLTTAELPFMVVRSFGLECRPIEQNVLMNIEGNDIFLYEIDLDQKLKKTERGTKLFRYRYRLFGGTKMMMRIVAENTIQKIRERI